jgi:hypothetical protein
MDTRPDPARQDPAGDYEYDLAHEQAPQARPGERHPGRHRERPPAARAVEYDSDMSYDQAHDF